MAHTVLIALCAAFAIASASIEPLPFPPSINTATSGSENLNIGHILNQNAFARDNSKIRQQSTIVANNAAGQRDTATATSDTANIPIKDPIVPHSLPIEHLYPYYSTPLDQAYYGSPVEPLYPYYGTPIEPLYPYYAVPPEFTYPYLPLETAYPYYGLEQSYYGMPPIFPSPYSIPTESLYPYYGIPSTPYYSPQQILPYNIPSSSYFGLPVAQPEAVIAEPLIAPVAEIPVIDLIDTTLLEAFYPNIQFPLQTHYAVNNNFKGVSAAANPVSAASEIVTDNTAFSKDVIPILSSVSL